LLQQSQSFRPHGFFMLGKHALVTSKEQTKIHQHAQQNVDIL